MASGFLVAWFFVGCWVEFRFVFFSFQMSLYYLFCEKVFSCGEPFRLWGVPIRVAEDFYRVEGFDLHIGNPIQFEIAPEFIRVYMPTGSCGNSVVRLYTNLQHHYDALIQAEDGNGRCVFEV